MPPPFRISGPTAYEPHQLVRLKAEGADPKAGLVWWISPDEQVERASTADDVLEFAAPPGTYTVKALAFRCDVATGKTVVKEARVSVVVKTCHPPPQPPQPPDPKPPEPPKPDPGQGTLNPSMAIGRIQVGNAGCSATVIGPRRPDGKWDVLTAAHCIPTGAQTGSMKMPASGKILGVRMVKLDRTCDVCWMETAEPVADIEYALLADRNPAVGWKVWHQGYGYDLPRNREEGEVTGTENSQGQLRFNLSVSSGDSGGGIFEATSNKVVSTVCCTSGMAKKAPMYGGSCEQILKLRPRTGGTGEDFLWHPLDVPLFRE